MEIQRQTQIGKKPFDCKECGTRTSPNNQLKCLMQKKHPGRKPFIFKTHGAGFVRSGNHCKHPAHSTPLEGTAPSGQKRHIGGNLAYS